MDGKSFLEKEREEARKRASNAGCALALLTILLALICGFTALGVAWILK